MTRVFSPASLYVHFKIIALLYPSLARTSTTPSPPLALLNLPLFSRAHYSKHIPAGRQSRLCYNVKSCTSQQRKKNSVQYSTANVLCLIINQTSHHIRGRRLPPHCPYRPPTDLFSLSLDVFGQMICIFFWLSIRIAEYSIAHSNEIYFHSTLFGPNNPEVPWNLSGIAATSKITSLPLRVVSGPFLKITPVRKGG